MSINHHNYEEYFILYMDNELGSDERRQVEAFVQKNPDLKEELDILLQYKLVPDTDIVFAGKEELMKPDLNEINNDFPVTADNYEEWLMLYTDNELTVDQKIAVDQFIFSHPSVKEELVLLQRTKLQPETIVFAHKESLYRKEEKVRVIPFRWWRIAAAAVLIIAVGLTTFMLVNKRSAGVKPEVAKSINKEQPANTPNPVVINKEENKPVITPVTPDSRKQDLLPAVKQPGNTIAVKKIIPNKKPGNTIQSVVKKEEPVIVDNKPSNNLPKPLNNATTKNDLAIDNSPKEIPNPSNTLTKKIVTTDPDDPSLAKTVSFVEPIDLNQSEKKGKLRGFFRKVTRTFEKRTNIDAADDDKLLVGGLAFKLK